MQPPKNKQNCTREEITKNCESQRSSKPPWPGIIVPESLKPELRLIRLSTKSPNTPARPLTSPKASASGIDIETPGIKESKHHTAIANTNPAIKPSQLLLEEILRSKFMFADSRTNQIRKGIASPHAYKQRLKRVLHPMDQEGILEAK